MQPDRTDKASLKESFSAIKPLLDKADAFWFDLDGTLADNEGDALDLIRDVISDHVKTQFGHAGITTCYRHLAGHKLHEIIENAERETGGTFSPEIKAAIEQEIVERRQSSLTPGDQVNAILPLAALAQYLKDEGKPFCVVTASEPKRALHYIEATGLGGIFEGDHRNWLFASNLKAKTGAHIDARQTLGKIHGFDIAPQRWVGFEDSPNAVKQGVEAHAVVIPHTLCTHISQQHLPARTLALQTAKVDALQANHIVEFTRAGDGLVTPIKTIADVQVIRTAQDLVPVLAATLSSLPERASAKSTAPAPRLGNGNS